MAHATKRRLSIRAPQEIQSYVYFEGGIATNASAPDAASALLKFLTERSTVRVIKSKGMEPW